MNDSLDPTDAGVDSAEAPPESVPDPSELPGASASLEHDPHASRIDPKDPRLSVQRHAPQRKLNTKPIVAGVMALVALGSFAIMFHARQPQKATITEEPSKSDDRAVVPSFIEQAPSTPRPLADRQPSILPPAPSAPLFAPPSALPPSRAAQIDIARQERARREREKDAELEEQARNAPIFFQTSTRESAERSASAPPALAMASAGFAPTPVLPGAAPSAVPSSVAFDPNYQDRKNNFLDSPKQSSDYLPTTIVAPQSPYELKATAIIPATLLTGINSDLPGPIIAQVRERVFDTVTGQYLLIPQGARLLATYDSMVAWGQERVLLCWNRLIFPNGRSINLRCMPAADLQGAAGLADGVDHHWARLLAAAGLSTVLSLGVQASAGNTTSYQPTIAQSAAHNAAGEINTIGQGIVQRQINIQPTITVRPGFGVNVIVNKDMILEPYVD